MLNTRFSPTAPLGKGVLWGCNGPLIFFKGKIGSFGNYPLFQGKILGGPLHVTDLPFFLREKSVVFETTTFLMGNPNGVRYM